MAGMVLGGSSHVSGAKALGQGPTNCVNGDPSPKGPDHEGPAKVWVGHVQRERELAGQDWAVTECSPAERSCSSC